MRSYFTVLMLMALAISAGLAARAHATTCGNRKCELELPKCEGLALKKVHESYLFTVGATNEVACDHDDDTGYYPCSVSSSNDRGYRYDVVLNEDCDDAIVGPTRIKE